MIEMEIFLQVVQRQRPAELVNCCALEETGLLWILHLQGLDSCLMAAEDIVYYCSLPGREAAASESKLRYQKEYLGFAGNPYNYRCGCCSLACQWPSGWARGGHSEYRSFRLRT